MLVLFGFALQAQTVATAVKFPALDSSPMDELYYPLNAPKVKKEDTSMPIIKVLYSRPTKKRKTSFRHIRTF